MRVRAVGAEALLLEVDDPAAWFAELTRRRNAGELEVLDIVPGARTVLLDGLADPTAAAESVRLWRADAVAAPAGPVVEIPVTFDGPDLEDVAKLWRVSPEDVARRLVGTALQVSFCGFAPGFAYLTGLPEELAIPRLPTPRPKVAAGSVGLADQYAGIYPTASPGGWRLVGHTTASLFDPARTPPALLAPGTRVRFVAIEPAGSGGRETEPAGSGGRETEPAGSGGRDTEPAGWGFAHDPAAADLTLDDVPTAKLAAGDGWPGERAL